MRVPSRLPTLALLVALSVAPVYAQDAEKCPFPEEWQLSSAELEKKLQAYKEGCPFPEEWQPSSAELEKKLQAHKEWLDKGGWGNPAVPGRAVLCNANLSGADLRGASLEEAQLQGANLSEADLRGADLAFTQLQGANLSKAKLRNATLFRAQLQGATLSEAKLQSASLVETVFRGADLEKANLQGATLYGAQFQNATLYEAQLQNAALAIAQLQGANLQGTDLQGADLAFAGLQGVNLFNADLSQTELTSAKLCDAELVMTNLDGARLTDANLFNAWYEPVTAPAAGFLTGLKGLTTLRFHPGRGSGLVLLRAQLANAGLRDLEREATYALERQITRHKLQAWREQPLSNLWVGLEYVFRLVAFEWPVAYGLYPGRALRILFASIGGFALIYLIPLSMPGTGGIHRVWPEGRLEAQSSTAKLVGEPKVERLRPRGWWGLKRLLRVLQFSLLSAFHLGFREINVGSWIARVQAHEYTLRATRWVRVIAGFQSLLSVYLLALWALTYFGRPFG